MNEENAEKVLKNGMRFSFELWKEDDGYHIKTFIDPQETYGPFDTIHLAFLKLFGYRLKEGIIGEIVDKIERGVATKEEENSYKDYVSDTNEIS